MKTDGIGFQPFKVSGSWRQPAWSSTGRLAAVRSVKRRSEVFVIDPRTGFGSPADSRWRQFAELVAGWPSLGGGPPWLD